jgi:RNA polymerase sigma-70 factor (ECF subfamily)
MQALLTEVQPKVFGMALWLCRDFHAAEDLKQTVLLLAVRKLDQVRKPEEVVAWFRSMVNTQYKNSIRGMAARRDRQSLRDGPDLSLEEILPSREQEPSSSVAMAEDTARILTAVDSLDDLSRDVLRLFYFEGLSTEQMAEQLGVPHGTVRRRLNTARQRLRERMTESYRS